MSAIQQLPRPEQLADLVSHAAAVKLAMDGQFDAKIAELKAAQKALADATIIAQTVEQENKIKNDAEVYAAAALAKARDALARAQDASDKAASRETLVAGREQAVSSRETAVDSRQAVLDSREQSIVDAQGAAARALAAREEAVKKAEAEVAAKQKKLASDQVAFNQRLDALKV